MFGLETHRQSNETLLRHFLFLISLREDSVWRGDRPIRGQWLTDIFAQLMVDFAKQKADFWRDFFQLLPPPSPLACVLMLFE